MLLKSKNEYAFSVKIVNCALNDFSKQLRKQDSK